MGDCDRGEGGGGVDGIVVKGCKKGAKKGQKRLKMKLF